MINTLCCRKQSMLSLYANPECKAMIWDSISRAMLFIAVLNLSTAILQYANMEAGCTRVKGHQINYNETAGRQQTVDEADLSDIDCEGTVFGGLRPSSTLSTMAAVANVFVALSLPLAGSLTDHTPYRKNVVVWSWFILWLSNGIQIFCNQSTWEVMVVIQAVVCATSYMFHQTSILCYITEIVSDMDGQLQELNMLVRVWELGTMLCFIIGVFIFSKIMDFDALQQATTGQAAACMFSIFPFWFVIKGLGERSPKRKVPQGMNLYSAGIANLKTTFVRVRTDFPQLFKMFIAIMFIESANSNIVNSCITLITQELEQEDPTFIIVMILIITVPGSALAPFLQRKVGVKEALIAIVGLNVLSTLFIVFFCYNPETAGRIPIAGFMYGIAIGATYPIQRTVFFKLSPFGQESEMFGIWQCCSIILQFLPALIFTGINQWLGSVRWAMLTLIGFWSIGVSLVVSLDFHKGVEDAKTTEHLKYADGAVSAKVAQGIAAEFANSQKESKVPL